MFLDEHVWAPLIMSAAFIVALLGVLALGAYVVYCDTRNRAGEKDLELAENHSQGGSHSIGAREAADMETVEAADPATARPPVTARSISRRRKPGAPPPA